MISLSVTTCTLCLQIDWFVKVHRVTASLFLPLASGSSPSRQTHQHSVLSAVNKHDLSMLRVKNIRVATT